MEILGKSKPSLISLWGLISEDRERKFWKPLCYELNCSLLLSSKIHVLKPQLSM